MSVKPFALCLFVLSLAATARATIVEIPFPELLGGYQNTQHTVSVVLPAPPLAIHAAWFRVSGTTVAGEMYCDETWPPSVNSFTIDLTAVLPSDDFSSGWYANDYPAMQEPGAFSATWPFRPIPFTADWSFLMDGVANLEFYGVDPGMWCQFLSSSSAVLAEAVLVIDADFTVAAQPSTWGRIKALYRR